MSSDRPLVVAQPAAPATEEPTNNKVRLANRLTWISPVAGILSALLTGMIYLHANFQGTPNSALIVAYGFAVALFAVPAIWLLWTIYRHGAQVSGVPGLRSMGTILAIVCLLFGSLISGQALVRVIADEIGYAVLRSTDPTPAETAYTPQELETAARDLVDESLSVLGDDAAFQGGDILESGGCWTSNSASGTYFVGLTRRETAVADNSSPTAVAATWEEMGLTITSSPGELNSLGQATVSATSDFLDGDIHYTVAEDGSVKLTLETICVLGELD
jgi:hypothetical protein